MRTRIFAAAPAVIAVLVLSACSGAPQAIATSSPALSRASELAIDDYQLAISAYNDHDFSGGHSDFSLNPAVSAQLYHQYLADSKNGADPRVLLTPVVKAYWIGEEGARRVTLCDASQNWYVAQGHTPSYDVSHGRKIVVEFSAQSHYELTKLTITGQKCLATGATPNPYDSGTAVPGPVDPATIIKPTGVMY